MERKRCAADVRRPLGQREAVVSGVVPEEAVGGAWGCPAVVHRRTKAVGVGEHAGAGWPVGRVTLAP